MSKRMSLAELIDSFDYAEGELLSLDSKFCAGRGIQTEVEPPAFYVDPSLTCTPPSGRDIVKLISAPAAVGKTQLARQLVRRLTGPRHVVYVPLQGTVIGENFFGGLMSQMFPKHPREQILDALFSGRIVLIFDGYDEVSMSSEQLARNRMFSEEVATAIRERLESGRDVSPCIVFLYRSVFDYLGIFEPLKPSASKLVVEFFERGQQRDYLQAHLSHVGAGAGAASLVPKFLDAFEGQLSVAGGNASAFFGHAIVLSAFGDYLEDQDEANAIKLANQLQDTVGHEPTAVEILSSIIEVIVERERHKFPNAEFNDVADDFDGYPPSLQARLLEQVAHSLARDRAARVELAPIVNSLADQHLREVGAYNGLSSDESDSLLRRYCEEVERKLRHHPFLDASPDHVVVFRNQIYREYYLARFLANNRETSAISLADTWQSTSYYLAFFLLALLAERDLAASAPDHLFFVLSLLASASTEQEAEYFVEWDSKKGRWAVDVDTDNLTIEQFFVGDEILQLELPNGGELANFTIATPPSGLTGVVSIGGPPGADERSSSMTVRSGYIAAETVAMGAGGITFDHVQLHCDTLEIEDRTARLQGVDSVELCPEHRRELRVSDFVRQRWSDALLQLPDDNAGGMAAFRELLKRVLLWFRKHGRSSYAVYVKRFDTVVLKKGRDATVQLFVDFLFDQGLLSTAKAGRLIVLEQADFAKYGVFYVQQNELSVDDTKCQPLFERWTRLIEALPAE